VQFAIESQDGVGERLDRFLQRKLPEISRSRLQDLIRDGHAMLNARQAKPSAELKPGDKIELTIPGPVSVEVKAQNIPIDVLHEDEHLIVINKAAGLVVHPAAGNPDGTLVNALLHHCDDLSGIGGEMRPGIVHRLDKETSGCMVVAKHDLAHTRLSEQFSDRRISKFYLAAVAGIPKEKGALIKNKIGRHPVDRKRMAVLLDGAGKDAVTEWRLLSTHSGCALILCRLLTGRTHQIRVHMKECILAPILGDPLYGHPSRQPVPSTRLMLHAWKLAFEHPVTMKPMAFEARIPDEYQPWLSDPGVLDAVKTMR
jgi:23S rRNA pseudouridine1911/1915/1917 synthase